MLSYACQPFQSRIKFSPRLFVIVTFKSVDEILWCDDSNETSSAVLSHGAICYVRSSNFWVCGWNPMVLPFKWNLLGRTLAWYYLFSRMLQFCFVTKRTEWVNTHRSLSLHYPFTNLVCRAGGCSSDPWSQTNTQGLKITQERRYSLCPTNGLSLAWLGWRGKHCVPITVSSGRQKPYFHKVGFVKTSFASPETNRWYSSW